jgi:hypothetical protein
MTECQWISDDTPIYHPTAIYRIPTLQEKLERIQAEIAKMDIKIARFEYPDQESVSAQDVYDHLKLRERTLLREIRENP